MKRSATFLFLPEVFFGEITNLGQIENEASVCVYVCVCVCMCVYVCVCVCND